MAEKRSNNTVFQGKKNKHGYFSLEIDLPVKARQNLITHGFRDFFVVIVFLQK